MKTMNVVIIILIILALFVTGYIFIKESFPSNSAEDGTVKYSFPVSKDAPRPKTEATPVYDLPSVNFPPTLGEAEVGAEPEAEAQGEPNTEDTTKETEDPSGEYITQ